MPVLPRREVCSRCQRAPVSNGVGGSAGVPGGRERQRGAAGLEGAAGNALSSF